jgi:hypothetical protein
MGHHEVKVKRGEVKREAKQTRARVESSRLKQETRKPGKINSEAKKPGNGLVHGFLASE